MSQTQTFLGEHFIADWRERTEHIVQTMREMSMKTDPQEVVEAYGERMQNYNGIEATVSLSRRDLEPPWFRITRSHLWTEEVNPWKEKDKLPLLQGGILGELLYGDEPAL